MDQEFGVAQVYNIISIVAFSLSGISLVFAVFFWFKFEILKVIGDLSGRTARKSIEKMREANENSGKKSFRPTPVAKNRGTLTEKIKETESSAGNDGGASTDDNATEILNYSSGGDTMLLDNEEAENNARSFISSEFGSFEKVLDIVVVHTEEVIR